MGKISAQYAGSKTVPRSQTKTQLEARYLQLRGDQLELENWQLETEIKFAKGSPEAKGLFLLGDTVDDGLIHSLMHDMTIWSANHPGQPITLLINTPGGVVISGYAFYDFLQELKGRGHHLTTKACGMAASMGSILLQAGDERVITARSWVLIHEVQGLVVGSFSQMEDDMRFNERLQAQALDILGERSNLSQTQIKNKWKRKDWWLDAPDTVKAGFADRIEA
jgi:ATP-dependent Clp endopeptidase proteolytic subunit ClpP